MPSVAVAAGLDRFAAPSQSSHGSLSANQPQRRHPLEEAMRQQAKDADNGRPGLSGGRYVTLQLALGAACSS